MKTLLQLCLLLFTVTLTAQTVFKLDSLHQFSWDDTMMDWKHDTRELYTYDNGGTKETNLLRLSLNLGVWENFYQFNKMYDGNNDLEESIQQTWDMSGMMWNNGSRDTYTYVAPGFVQNHEYAIYSAGSWLVFNDNTYAYDAMWNEIENVQRDLNFATFMLENKIRYTNFYTGQVRNYEIVELWQSPANIWVNDEKSDYSYNGNGDISLEEIRAWQTMSLDWSDPYRQNIFTYDLDDMLEEVLEQIYASGSWNNQTRALYSYTFGNLTELVGQEWNSGTMLWDNSFQQLRTYDVDDNEIELIYETWDLLGGVWEGFLRILKFWSPEDTLSVTFSEFSEETLIYPNPATTVINIKFNSASLQQTKALLYDINGKLIHQTVIVSGLSEFKIPIIENAQGMYILHLENANGKQIFKILKD